MKFRSPAWPLPWALFAATLAVPGVSRVLAQPEARAADAPGVAPGLASAGTVDAEQVTVGDGDDAGPLALEEVLASVERHHPSLQALEGRVRAAEGGRLAAEGGFDPVLTARGFGSAGYYRYARTDATVSLPTPLWGASFFAGWRLGRSLEASDFPDYYRYDETLDGGELRAGVTVPILRDGAIDARRAGIARAERAVEAAEHERAARRWRVRLAASEAYARWVASGLKLAVVEALLHLAEARDAQIAARVAAGAVAAIEHLENQRAVLERRQARVAARRSVERTAIALSLYFRDEAGAPRVPDLRRLPEALSSSAVVPMDESEAIEVALSRRPEIVRLGALREAARVVLELAENQVLPRLDVSVNGSIDLGSTDDGSLRSQLSPPTGEALVSLSVPLLFREGTGRLRAARAELDALDAEIELARDQITLEVRDACSAVAAAREALAAARESAQVAAAVAAAERSRFDAGASTLLFVNLRETAAAQADASVIDAEADVAVAAAQRAAAMAESVDRP